MHQAGIGGISHGLGLDGGVDGHSFEILRGESPGLVRHGEAFLQQGGEMLLAQPLAPARQGGAVKRQIMAEADLAAEELHVRAVEKAGAQHLVGQALHVLEDHQAGHQSHRQGRLAGSGLEDAAEPALEEGPVDVLSQPHQRMLQVDDAVQGRAEQILLALVSWGRHEHLRPEGVLRIESDPAPKRQWKTQEIHRDRRTILQDRMR